MNIKDFWVFLRKRHQSDELKPRQTYANVSFVLWWELVVCVRDICAGIPHPGKLPGRRGPEDGVNKIPPSPHPWFLIETETVQQVRRRLRVNGPGVAGEVAAACLCLCQLQDGSAVSVRNWFLSLKEMTTLFITAMSFCPLFKNLKPSDRGRICNPPSEHNRRQGNQDNKWTTTFACQQSASLYSPCEILCCSPKQSRPPARAASH